MEERKERIKGNEMKGNKKGREMEGPYGTLDWNYCRDEVGQWGIQRHPHITGFKP